MNPENHESKKYTLVFTELDKYKLERLSVGDCWYKLQELATNKDKNYSPLEKTVFAAAKEGFETPLYQILGFCKLIKNKSGDFQLISLHSEMPIEDMATVYVQEYEIPENVQLDMKAVHKTAHKYTKSMKPEANPPADEATKTAS